VVGGANSKVMAQHSGQGRTCLPSLVEFGPTVFLKTLTEGRGHTHKKKKKRDRQNGRILAFFHSEIARINKLYNNDNIANVDKN